MFVIHLSKCQTFKTTVNPKTLKSKLDSRRKHHHLDGEGTHGGLQCNLRRTSFRSRRHFFQRRRESERERERNRNAILYRKYRVGSDSPFLMGRPEKSIILGPGPFFCPQAHNGSRERSDQMSIRISHVFLFFSFLI